MLRVCLVVFGLLLTNLTFAQKAKVVQGNIVDVKTKKAIDNVELTIQSEDTDVVYTTHTNAKGEYQFKNIPFGKYDLVVTDETYNPEISHFELTEDHADNFTFDEFSVGRKVSWLLDWGDSGEVEHYWSHIVSKIIIVVYFGCLLLVLFYSILQLSLAIAYVRNKRRKKRNPEKEVKPVYDPANTPKVTVQLPMFNELYVAERIIETAAAFDYPKDKLQIQVLDDSTDETVDVIAKKVAEVSERGISLEEHINRLTDSYGS